tara:strand:- start:267 stop:413 length:147 start_codon:yes stop_codon:yes gene_type:complete
VVQERTVSVLMPSNFATAIEIPSFGVVKATMVHRIRSEEVRESEKVKK